MPANLGGFWLSLVGDVAFAAAGCGQVKNPEGAALIITRATLYVKTPSLGAANINIGIGNQGADNSNLISALAVNGAITGKAYNGPAPAAKAEYVVWGADQYLTATASANANGFTGRVYVEYQHAIDPEG